MSKITKIDSKRYDFLMALVEKKLPNKAKKIKAEKAKKEGKKK
jgi:hypothetical protein